MWPLPKRKIIFIYKYLFIYSHFILRALVLVLYNPTLASHVNKNTILPVPHVHVIVAMILWNKIGSLVIFAKPGITKVVLGWVIFYQRTQVYRILDNWFRQRWAWILLQQMYWGRYGYFKPSFIANWLPTFEYCFYTPASVKICMATDQYPHKHSYM